MHYSAAFHNRVLTHLGQAYPKLEGSMEEREDIRDELAELYRLMQKFWSIFSHRLNPHLVDGGVNGPQYMTMLALDKLGEATMGEVANNMHVTMGASTNIVDKLLELGLASRARCVEDRRVVRVKLEPKGHAVLKTIEDLAVDYLADIAGDATPEECQHLLECYGRLVAGAVAREMSQAATQ